MPVTFIQTPGARLPVGTAKTRLVWAVSLGRRVAMLSCLLRPLQYLLTRSSFQVLSQLIPP